MSDPTAIVVFGIDNCDQVRKARGWLRGRGLPYRFHDFRRDGLDASLLDAWLTRLPWDALLNRRGLTWRRLSAAERASIVDQASAVEAMLREPTLVKRPVLATGEHVVVGFTESVYARLLDERDANE
ncbi:MAG: ArsC family reductase [Burkholderiaceae bacterium]|nr:ArsC family reductase [Burkholderiaceae bacterium]